MQPMARRTLQLETVRKREREETKRDMQMCKARPNNPGPSGRGSRPFVPWCKK